MMTTDKYTQTDYFTPCACTRGNYLVTYITVYSRTLICCLVSCLQLTNPMNGIISCSLGDDGVPSYEDTCNFTCNTGYKLTGSDNRTCQSDGSWSGSDVLCRATGKVHYVQIVNLLQTDVCYSFLPTIK